MIKQHGNARGSGLVNEREKCEKERFLEENKSGV